MRKCFLVSLLTMLLGSYAQVHHAGSLAPQSAPDPEEYGVYAAVLKAEFIGKETTQLVIKKHTRLAIDDFFNKDPVQIFGQSPLTKETAADFKSKNEQSSELSNDFNLQVKINLPTKDEVRELFNRRDGKHDGWTIFNQKYPTAKVIITLSRVGFNAERTQALIFVAYECGPQCAEGDFILLTKKDGAWKVEKKSMAWTA